MFARTAVVAIAFLLGPAASAQGRIGPGDIFERMDANNDGSVSREEFVAARQAAFEERDKNADGYLDDEDLGKRAARRAKLKQRATDVRERLDTDGDGRISREEFVNAETPLFDRADKDGNDVLDPQELAEAKAAFKAQAEKMRSKRM